MGEDSSENIVKCFTKISLNVVLPLLTALFSFKHANAKQKSKHFIVLTQARMCIVTTKYVIGYICIGYLNWIEGNRFAENCVKNRNC